MDCMGVTGRPQMNGGAISSIPLRRRTVRLFLVLLAILVLVGCRSSDRPSPTATQPSSMKGYELYSWSTGDDWTFALVVGTNRVKSLEELLPPPDQDQGLEWLRRELERLPEGEQVFWSAGRVAGTSLPPEELIQTVQSHCDQVGVELQIVQDQPETFPGPVDMAAEGPPPTATAPPEETDTPPAATPITPSPTVLPSSTPIPPAPAPAASPPLAQTSVPSTSPTIHQFKIIELEDTDYGKRITFVWSAEGISARLFSGTRQRMQDWWVVPLSGTLTVEAHGTVYPDPAFTLEVCNSDDWYAESSQKVVQSIRIEWACDPGYFFAPAPERCPLGPATFSPAAEQRFEGGRMIWLEAVDAIYVFYDERPSGSEGARRFPDTWSPAEPESDPTILPPEGLHQPVRGFGKVWREFPQVRERLGWALAPEQGFEGTLQHENHEGSSSGARTFLRTADGRVIWWWHPSWGFVEP
jgi:hypothetical protein